MAALISLGRLDELVLGNLDARRVWRFAGHYVEAMWLMLQQPKADDYIVSTGSTHSIRDFLDVAFAIVGLEGWEKHVSVDPAFLRPAEVIDIVGDSTKARPTCRWRSKVAFPEIVAMMIEAGLLEQQATAR